MTYNTFFILFCIYSVSIFINRWHDNWAKKYRPEKYNELKKKMDSSFLMPDTDKFLIIYSFVPFLNTYGMLRIFRTHFFRLTGLKKEKKETGLN